MNIHPLFVHFPIALLLTYAGLELIRFKHFYTKATLVILGVLSGIITVITGLMAKSLVKNEELMNVVVKHEFWAITSLVIFAIPAVIYLIAWIKNSPQMTENKLIPVLALAGIICLSITGALGGSVAFGPNIDPFTNWIYDLFF